MESRASKLTPSAIPRALASLLIALLFASTAAASTTEPDTRITPTQSIISDGNDIYGLWVESKKQKVAVLIEDCKGKLCGHIYWLKKPLTREGKHKRDPHNPDVALRQRPLCGMKILSGFSHEKENKWSGGEVYNPKDGYTFRSTIKQAEDGSLKIRGYIGIPLFGKTTKWQRPEKDMQQCEAIPETDTL